jgi:hypothetical protein
MIREIRWREMYVKREATGRRLQVIDIGYSVKLFRPASAPLVNYPSRFTPQASSGQDIGDGSGWSVKAARVRSTGMAPLASGLAHVAPAQVIWPRRSHARSRGAGSPLRARLDSDTCIVGQAGSVAANVLRGTDATEQARDVKAKRCGDPRVAHGLLAGRHVSTRAHGCMRATRTRSSMHSIRSAAHPSRSRCSGTPRH